MSEKHRDLPPTKAELEILSTLWSLGSGTVKEVQQEISKRRPMGYTTALKLMQIMFGKGLLARTEDAKAHIYRPVASADHTRTGLLEDFLARAFGGSATMLIQHALSNKVTTPEEIAEIRSMLDQMELKP